MSFFSVNGESDTHKKGAMFLLACAIVNISKARKRENWLRENVKSVDALHLLSRPQSLFSISLSDARHASLRTADTFPVVASLPPKNS